MEIITEIGDLMEIRERDGCPLTTTMFLKTNTSLLPKNYWYFSLLQEDPTLLQMVHLTPGLQALNSGTISTLPPGTEDMFSAVQSKAPQILSQNHQSNQNMTL